MLAVAVALRPAEFDYGAEIPDGSEQQIFGERYSSNPKELLDESDFEMLEIWSQYRRGYLPDDGGVMDQAAIMLEALALMESTAIRVEDPKRGLS